MEDRKKEIISYLSEMVNYHEGLVTTHTKLADTFRAALDALKSVDVIFDATDSQISHTIADSKPKKKITAKKKISKGKKPVSTKEILINRVKMDNMPLPADTLRLEYNASTGKNLDKNGFSPHLVRAQGDGGLQKVIINGNPINMKFLYALPEMMDGKELRTEYLQKVKAGTQAQLL